jgi:hypothetical protein
MTQLEAIKKRLSEATPGPWSFTQLSGLPQVYGAKPGDVSEGEWICTCELEADQKFITFAPDDISFLLGEVERLEKKITEAFRLARDMDCQCVQENDPCARCWLLFKINKL